MAKETSLRSFSSKRAAALGLVALFAAAGCVVEETLKPTPGLMQYMTPLVLHVPGGTVSLATGNLQVERTDLSLDTSLGPLAVGAIYNSANDSWRWSFDLQHDGHHFTDASGAWHDVSHVGIGETIPGTHWVVVDDHTMRTKSGFTYAFEDGWLASVHWWRNPDSRLDFRREVIAGQSRVTAIEYRCSGAYCGDPFFTLEYDGAGNVERIVDHTGREAKFSYDAEGRLVNARDALDIAEGWPGTSYGYATLASGENRLASLTSSEGERIEFEFEGPRQQISRLLRVGEGNPETRFHYGSTAAGYYETVVTHPDANSARYRYDAMWRLLSFDNEAGETETFTWTDMKLASRTDAAGLITRWSYAIEKEAIPGYTRFPIPVREQVTETQPSGNIEVTLHDRQALAVGAASTWPLLSRMDSLGTLESREYDEFGRLTLIANGAGESTGFGFYNGGGVFPDAVYTSHNSSFFSVPANQYGKPANVAVPYAGGGSVFGANWRYDKVGNLLKGGGTATPTSAGRPGIASRGFNADRELTSLELWSQETGDGAELGIERRSDGQPTRITRPFGGDTEFDYDDLGRRVARRERVNGAWQTTTWEYDGRDRITAFERPNGMRTQTRYDGAGRVKEVRHLRGGVVEKILWQTWQNGRLAVRFDSAWGANESFAYNGAGQISSVLYPDGESLEFDYDLRGRVTEERYRLADTSLLRTLGFAYDDAGRPQRLSEDGATLLEWSYADGKDQSFRIGWPRDGGSLRSIDYGNGLRRSFRATSQGDLYHYRWSSTGGLGAVIEDTQIRADIDCSPQRTVPVDCIRITETALPTGRSDNFAVELYKLSPGTRVDYGVTNLWLEERIAGARVESSGVWVEGPLELTAQGDAHDALGNRLFGEDAYNPERNRLQVAEGHSYAYDAAGFVVERDGKAFEWDAMGRIARIGENPFAWDSLGRPVAKTISGTQTRYLFGGRVEADANRSPMAMDLKEVRLDLVNCGHLYRHFDFRNNVQFVTNDAGEVVRAYTYTAYGVASVYDAATDSLSFAEGESLGDVVRLGVRLYDPEVGRFLSPDPFYQVVNQYSYAEGNPVLFWDPEGDLPRSCTVRIEPPNPAKKHPFDWTFIIECSCGLGFESGLAVTWIAAVRHRRRAKRARARATPPIRIKN